MSYGSHEDFIQLQNTNVLSNLLSNKLQFIKNNSIYKYSIGIFNIQLSVAIEGMSTFCMCLFFSFLKNLAVIRYLTA